MNTSNYDILFNEFNNNLINDNGYYLYNSDEKRYHTWRSNNIGYFEVHIDARIPSLTNNLRDSIQHHTYCVLKAQRSDIHNIQNGYLEHLNFYKNDEFLFTPKSFSYMHALRKLNDLAKNWKLTSSSISNDIRASTWIWCNRHLTHPLLAIIDVKIDDLSENNYLTHDSIREEYGTDMYWIGYREHKQFIVSNSRRALMKLKLEYPSLKLLDE